MNRLRQHLIPACARIGAPTAFVFTALALIANPPASANVLLAPWSGNIAYVSSKSTAGGVVDLQSMSPPSAAPWSGMPFSNAHNDTTGADAFAFMSDRKSVV